MKITRRLLLSLLLFAVAPLFISFAQTLEKAATKTQYIAYVGTYTSKTTSKGFRAHVASEYPDTDKARETLDIIEFIEKRAVGLPAPVEETPAVAAQ